MSGISASGTTNCDRGSSPSGSAPRTPASASAFEALVESLPQIVWTAGPDGVIDYCSRRWTDHTGMSVEDALGWGWIAAVEPAEAMELTTRWKAVVLAGQPFEFDIRLRRASDNSFRWHLARAAPSRDSAGRIGRWCGAFTDIDDRKARTEGLRTVERFLESIVENIPDMVFVKDAADLRFVRVNKGAEDKLGAPRHLLIGRNDYDLFSKEDADLFTSNDRTVLKSGKLLDIPEETLHAANGARVMHTKKIPILDEHGEPRYLLGIARDITDRKRAQELVLEKNRLLEEALRSLKDAQAQLVQSEKLAGLGQLVAGVAHEINNPLAFVTNNVVVMQRDFIPLIELIKLYQSTEEILAANAPDTLQKIRELSDRFDVPYILEGLDDTLTRSREGLKRIQQIVKDLREFSRQEAFGDVQEGIDLNPGIASTVNIVRGRAKSQNVELQMDLSPLPGISCFPAKINQVVMNLLTNAIDACEGGGKVTIRSRQTESGVELQVADNGCGIDPQVREKIFDPFFTTKPQGKGTGLGLSISHGIIGDHGGRIAIDSSNKGTCFIVSLPLKPPPRQEDSKGKGRR